MNNETDLLKSLLAKAKFRSSGIGANLSLDFSWTAPLLVLRISGSSSDPLPESFTDAVSNLLQHVRPTQVAVDLSACQSLPSLMLAFLVFFHKTAEQNGAHKVVLLGANSRIQTLVKMIGMNDFFVYQADLASTQEWFASLPAILPH